MNEQNENITTSSAEAKGIAGVLGHPEGVIRQICTSRRFGEYLR